MSPLWLNCPFLSLAAMLHPSVVIFSQVLYPARPYGFIYLGMHNGTSERNTQISQEMCLGNKVKPITKDVHLSMAGLRKHMSCSFCAQTILDG